MNRHGSYGKQDQSFKIAVLLALMTNPSLIVSLKTSYKSLCYIVILPVIELCLYGIYAFA
jgi:hypothetical protein